MWNFEISSKVDENGGVSQRIDHQKYIDVNRVDYHNIKKIHKY